MTGRYAFPTPALYLGLGGLVPFWALAGGLATGVTFGHSEAVVASALVAYGAIILSFLGGIRWGIAMFQEEAARASRNFIISIVPALLAWALFLVPGEWRLSMLAVLLIALGIFDYGLVCREEAPEWFGTLRLILANAAGLAVIVAAVSA